MDRYAFDADYVARLSSGDPIVQRHFVSYFNELLGIKLRSRLRSPQLIEDARQETLLRVLVALRNKGIEHPERLGAFVNAVCNNVLFEFFRTEGRVSPMPDDGPEPADESDDPERLMVTKQRKKEVKRVLDELPPKDRELLKRVFLEERDKDSVCRDFDVDREYLRVLLHRAKSRFRTVFEAREGAAAKHALR